MATPTRAVLLQLLGDARITGAELDAAVRRALDADYWRGLMPACHIESADAVVEFAPQDADRIDGAIRAERRDGHFRLPGLIAPEGVVRLNAAIDAVTAAGWPAAFAFVYDELWRSGRSPASSRVLESVLGPGFRQIRHVWAHVVKPVAGSAGWSPHVDGDSGRRMTLWIALTPATLDNGCMHVVPARAIDASPDLISRFGTSHSQFSRAEVVSMLHATQALVASPGDALGWSFDVIHWGGVVRRAGEERRALSFEYIAADEAPSAGEHEQVSMDALPPFGERLRAVAGGVVSYAKFEPRIDRFIDVAHEITKRLEPAG